MEVSLGMVTSCSWSKENSENAERSTPNAQCSMQRSELNVESWTLGVGRFLLLLEKDSASSQITASAPAFSQPGSWARGLVGIVSFSINSRGVVSGGSGGGIALRTCAAHSAGNVSMKTSVGPSQDLPNTEMRAAETFAPIAFKV